MKRYSKTKINKVHALLSKGYTVKQVAKKTGVTTFSINYYKAKTRRTFSGINTLQKLIRNFQKDLNRISLQ